MKPAHKIVDQTIVIVKRPFSRHTYYNGWHCPGNQHNRTQETPPLEFHVQNQCQANTEYDMKKHGNHHKNPREFQCGNYFLIFKYIKIIGNTGKFVDAAQNPDIVEAVEHCFNHRINCRESS